VALYEIKHIIIIKINQYKAEMHGCWVYSFDVTVWPLTSFLEPRCRSNDSCFCCSLLGMIQSRSMSLTACHINTAHDTTCDSCSSCDHDAYFAKRSHRRESTNFVCILSNEKRMV